jgi:hypothetical protein
VRPIDEARKLDLRPLLAVAGVVAVIVTIWATGAFGAAGGGSSSGNQSSTDPAAAFVQSQNAQPAPGDDCPEHQNGGGSGGGSGGSSGGSSGGGSSGSGDL